MIEILISPLFAAPAASKEGNLPEALLTLVIDPGHPSEISNGATANGLREIDINWEIAQALAAKLANCQRLKVLINRQEKMKLMTNRERAEFANKVHAFLNLRLHCDYDCSSSKGKCRSGFTIYYPDTQGTISGKRGPSEKVIADSRKAALAVHLGMAKRLAGILPDCGIKPDRATTVGAKTGGALIGSIYSEVPTITVEMIYLNNPNDAKFISSPEGKQAMVEALSEGVFEYIKSCYSSKEGF